MAHLRLRLRLAVSMTPVAPILFVLLVAAWIIPLLLLFAGAIPTWLLVIAGYLAICFPSIILLLLIVLHIGGQIRIVVGSMWMAIRLQIAVIEERKEEAAEKLDDDDNKPSEDDPSSQPNLDSSDVKPDMNDVAMEEAQASDKDQISAYDNSRTNLDLNLGLKATDGDRETKPRDADQDEGSNRPEKISSGVDIEMKTTTTNSKPQTRQRRKPQLLTSK